MAASVSETAGSASGAVSAVASASATASRIACGTSSIAGAISGSAASAAGAFFSTSTSISVARGLSVTCRIDRLTRRRGTSTSITFARTSSPTDSTDSGVSTCSWLSSEMWTRPSMPGATRTNAPNGTSFVT